MGAVPDFNPAYRGADRAHRRDHMRRQRTSPDYQKAVGVFPCQNLSPECRIRAGLSRSHRGAIRHEPRGAGLAIEGRHQPLHRRLRRIRGLIARKHSDHLDRNQPTRQPSRQRDELVAAAGRVGLNDDFRQGGRPAMRRQQLGDQIGPAQRGVDGIGIKDKHH